MAIDLNNLGNTPPPSRDSASTQTRGERGTRADANQAERQRTEQEVRLSDEAQALRREQARASAEEAPFDDAKVRQLQQAISEGNYPIDTQRLAQKFIELENLI